MTERVKDGLDRRAPLKEGIPLLARACPDLEVGAAPHEPLDEGGRARARPDETAPPAESPGTRRPRLLVVDDEEALAELLRRDLKKRGYDVVAHSAPGRAVDEFRQDPASWDAVVTDAAMPGMSGLDLARAVLATRPGMVVVVTSGWIDEALEAAGKTAGIRALLLKASTIEQYGRELDGILRSLLARGPDTP